jgi:hypothetical protein
MKLTILHTVLTGLIIFIGLESANAAGFKKNKNHQHIILSKKPTEFLHFINSGNLHNDSIHKLNFKYHDKKRGLKPFIAPTLLISAGTTLHFSTDTKENFQDWSRDNFTYSGHADDYIQYAPLAVVYSLNAFGIKGKNNFGNRTALALKSILLNDLIVNNLKTWSKTKRPNGEMRSFPSGHTSFTFAMAHFMHKEYGELSRWYSIGAYTCAATVGIMRVAKNAHWFSDVVAGAGVGILSTELVYLTHLYKWDNEHLKNFDIFPFKMGNKKGITLVYKF